MACLASEKSPLAQKRCSLPGPGGALALYSTHQQRRLSERGLMIYKPNKPDIDLIRDFTNANQRKHSTPNITLYPGGPGPSRSSGGGLKYAQGTFGSLSQLNRNIYTPSSAGPSPSAYRRNSSLASFSSYVASSSNAGGSGSSADGVGSGNGGNNTNTNGSSTSSSVGAAGGSARKVRIRIQKNPGSDADKYVELQSIGRKTTFSTSTEEDPEGEGLDGDEMTENERNLFLKSPLYDSRRFSDSAVCRGPTPAITFSLTSDLDDGNGCNNPVPIQRRASDTSAGIVLSTGDLETLKCLTSSAQEISSTGTVDQSDGSVSPSNLGNRSKSFDATLSLSKRGLGSSWFARRHLPISHKLPNASSPAANQPLPQIRTPILTITNENACQSELIEIPSPPTVTPVSSGGSPSGEVTATVTWDKNGYVLDAALLGSAIESHLKEGNRKRRATFSTLYQAPPSSVECKVTTRARSASACVIPINPKDLQQSSSGNRRESISTDRVIPNFPLSEKGGNRRSSLKSIVRFPWDSGKDQQSSETKSLLWESPVEYTNTGSFIRTTVTDFGAECIDEEDEESRTPETTNSTCTTTTTTTTTGNNGGNAEVSDLQSPASSSTSNGGNGKKGIKGFELPSSSKGKTGDRDISSSHSYSAPSSPKPGASKTKRQGSESSMSICSAIRDFIIHSIRS